MTPADVFDQAAGPALQAMPSLAPSRPIQIVVTGPGAGKWVITKTCAQGTTGEPGVTVTIDGAAFDDLMSNPIARWLALRSERKIVVDGDLVLSLTLLNLLRQVV